MDWFLLLRLRLVPVNHCRTFPAKPEFSWSFSFIIVIVYVVGINVMGKTCKVVICGQAAVGKTAILEQLINGDHVVGSVS